MLPWLKVGGNKNGTDGEPLLLDDEFLYSPRQQQLCPCGTHLYLRKIGLKSPQSVEAESASDDKIDELVDLVDISGDGLVNYLE